jgi:hypothetical protein
MRLTREQVRQLEVLAMFAELCPRSRLEEELHRRHQRQAEQKRAYEKTPKGKATKARNRPQSYANLRNDPVRWKAYCARVLERRKERIAADPGVGEAMRAYFREYNRTKRAVKRQCAEAAE